MARQFSKQSWGNNKKHIYLEVNASDDRGIDAMINLDINFAQDPFLRAENKKEIQLIFVTYSYNHGGCCNK